MGMKLTSAERIARSQLIPDVGWTTREYEEHENTKTKTGRGQGEAVGHGKP